MMQEALSVPNPVLSTALARADHPVLVCDGHSLTARELRGAVAVQAFQLHQQGIGPGAVVAFCGPPSMAWVAACHAVGWVGATLAPLPYGAPRPELSSLLDELKPDAIAAPPAELSRLANGAKRLPLTFDLPSGRHDALALVADLAGCAASARKSPQIASPSRLADDVGIDAMSVPERFWPLDELRAIIYTSGTTGRPKRVELTTAQLLFSAFGSAIRLGHDLHDRWLGCLPLHHIGGLSILIRCALMGTCVVLHPRFDAARVARELDSGAVTLVSLVPTMLERVLDARRQVPFPSSLRAILVGGASTPQPLIERCRAIGAPLALTWGMTETASQIATRFSGDLAIDGSSGAPLPFARVEAVEGRLAVRGPLVRSGALTSGDIGRVDDVGRVHVMARADDTIVSGGEKIVPNEVERVLLGHPAIAEVAVVGRDESRWGERPVAFVVPSTQPVSERELVVWCRQRMAAFKVPDLFQWCDRLPRNRSGKLQRGRLRQLAGEQTNREPPQCPLPAPDATLERLAASTGVERLQRLSGELHELQRWLAGDLVGIEQQISDLGGSAQDLARRAAGHLLSQPGKRIRPLCLLLGARLGGMKPTDQLSVRLADLALACEFVHAATLLHDDVIDVGTERRGAPAARMLYGNTASILGGDHLLTEALRRVRASGTPELLDRLLQTIDEMIAAEALQLEQQHRFDPRPELYLRIVEGKTAALFRWALEAGTILGQQPPEVVNPAATLGGQLGIAFQLMDDLLDFTGDPQQVGKDTLSDLREGKLTWPLLVAARRDARLAADLRAAAGSELEGASATALVQRIRDTGAVAATEGAAAEYAARARQLARALPESRASAALGAVIEFCVARVK